MTKINCDMGESFGIYNAGNDEQIMPLIDVANVACGFHASDPNHMRKTVELAKKNKVKVFRLPVHSKNPILIFFNTIILSILILIKNIKIVHARSRAPAWACYLACLLTRRNFVTTFHGTYNFQGKVKKFYKSIQIKNI